MSKKTKDELYEKNQDKFEKQYICAMERLVLILSLDKDMIRAIIIAHISNGADIDALATNSGLPKRIINMIIAAPEKDLDCASGDYMEFLRNENEESDEYKIDALLQIMRLDADVPKKYQEAISALIC